MAIENVGDQKNMGNQPRVKAEKFDAFMKEKVYTDVATGTLVNSGFLDGLSVAEGDPFHHTAVGKPGKFFLSQQES